MELLGERPAWSMSSAEVLSTLDQVDAALARVETYRLQLIARIDVLEHAQELGAHSTAQLLEFRYRLDRSRALRDVRLARSLAKYDAVSAALPDPHSDPTDADAHEATEVVLRPAQAEAIVSALDQVPSKVPAEDVAVAERELIGLARHLSPFELRRAGQRIRDVLDTDGPEPEEHKAYARETLTLTQADRGVKFRGYLANENAELFRSLIHAGARPHKTLDGDPDPRSREKRQADALTTTLTIAATALEAGTPTPRTPRPTGPDAGSTPSSASSTRSTNSTTDASDASDAENSARGAEASRGIGDGEAIATIGSTSGGSGGSGGTSTSTSTSNACGASPANRTGLASGTSGEGADGRVAGPEGATGAGVSRGPDGAADVPGFGAKANITITIDLQDLKSAAADAIGDTVYGDGLSAAAIRRLACDAKVIPLVLGTNSEPLDVGRSERLVTRAMRRALNTRDRGCVVCGAPPIQCDAHHLISWIDGGETKISNLVLLCRRHHIDLHAGDWTITILDGKVHVARPTWADPPPHPTTIPKPPHAQTPSRAARHSSTPNHNPSTNAPPHHDGADQRPTHVASTDVGGTTMQVPRDHPRRRQVTTAPTPTGQSSCDVAPTRHAPHQASTHRPSNDRQPRDREPDRGANDRDVDGWEEGDRGSTEQSVARAAVTSVVRRSALGRQLLRRLRAREGSADDGSAGKSGAGKSGAGKSGAGKSGAGKSGAGKSGA
ncbi:DUF222 domain-containing protein, partial [Kribbella sp. NPDC058693]|uniref:DUF222 domain-containing protein n=1 Tax=Kribbella sp. NPDC058693 TaxID=3346602 RepID=UPI0036521213